VNINCELYTTTKTYNLSGPSLHWAVAHCRAIDDVSFKVQWRHGCLWDESTGYEYRPSYDWEQGGPIVEQALLCIDIGHDGVWLACSKQNYDDFPKFICSGSSPLVAAMRCYVSSKVGSSINIPTEIK
jgi:hypothetical protein